MAPTPGLGESTTVQEVPGKQKMLSSINTNIDTNNILVTQVTRGTFGAVSADAFPDNELPLPQHRPDQIPWATADLDHLPRERHLLPQTALRIVVVDSLSEPDLNGEKRRVRSSSMTVSDLNHAMPIQL